MKKILVITIQYYKIDRIFICTTSQIRPYIDNHHSHLPHKQYQTTPSPQKAFTRINETLKVPGFYCPYQTAEACCNCHAVATDSKSPVSMNERVMCDQRPSMGFALLLQWVTRIRSGLFPTETREITVAITFHFPTHLFQKKSVVVVGRKNKQWNYKAITSF
ncbi:hypothetical protein JTE90_011204 [Oedothorax gibbosus]|uniref:Uncharacterized protein n=1 Tax=Oedothorax gibbosus TaxID=931172 RepID=A0AAV6VY16_9ARAC|nr:hypothetical protein JTE90_011204 [Oedothorax gibbosus]